MLKAEEKAEAEAEFARLSALLAKTVGMGPLDKVEDWLREGMTKTNVVNANVKGDILRRVSIHTKNRVLRETIITFGGQP